DHGLGVATGGGSRAGSACHCGIPRRDAGGLVEQAVMEGGKRVDHAVQMDARERDLLAQLQATFDHEIPLSRAIGLTALRYDARGLTLGAPLAPNTNHKSTAFAGSLNAAATLAGWGLVWLLLRERGLAATIVIQESETRYQLPVRGDFAAICALPPAAEIEQL